MSRRFHHFRDDPFFNYDEDMDFGFKNLESMFSYPAIEGNSSSNNKSVSKRNDEFGMFDHFFGDMHSRFKEISNMMDRDFSSFEPSVDPNDPNSSFYSSSSVYQLQKGPRDAEPQIYQAHKSVRQGPGGVREEQKAVRDTRRAEEKMAIGRYIKDKGREVERRRDMKTGEKEERRNYRGMGESDEEEFDTRWDSLTKKSFSNELRSDARRYIKDKDSRYKEGGSKQDRRAITEGNRGRHK